MLSTNGGGPTPEVLDPLSDGDAAVRGGADTAAVDDLADRNQHAEPEHGDVQLRLSAGISHRHLVDGDASTTRRADDEQRAQSNYSPQLQSTFRVQATQHLLQGFGPWVNGRFIIQAKNDRRITDSAFRQQLLYTVTQVESIYWGLVSAYEDEQAKERALTQSTQLACGQPEAVGDWHAGAAGCGELGRGGGDGQAGAGGVASRTWSISS